MTAPIHPSPLQVIEVRPDEQRMSAPAAPASQAVEAAGGQLPPPDVLGGPPVELEGLPTHALLSEIQYLPGGGLQIDPALATGSPKVSGPDCDH